MLRLTAILALGITSLAVACSSSSDDPAAPPDTMDSGASSSGSSGSSSGSSGTSGGPTDAATDSPTDAADAADASTAFVITSTAFKEGGAIPLAQACTNQGGMNQSPPLAWTSGPATTLSYAIEIHDATNNLVHGVIYDIPATDFALPGNLMSAYMPTTPAGAHEAKNINNTFGYAGPCPPNQHTYEFILYAVDVATLPGTTMTTVKEDIVTALKAHMLATTKLTGTFTPP